MSKISASLMCSNPYTLQSDIQTLENANIDYLHMDIMDGHFVPNLGFSIDFIQSIRQCTSLPFDFHLMVENPLRIIPRLSLQKGDIVSIHFEASYYLEDIITRIKNYECELFIALNPQTPVCILGYLQHHIDGVNFLTINPGFSGQKILPMAIEKFLYLKSYLLKNHLEHISIEVDGNMSFENVKKFKEMGADIFVAGTSSIFPNKKLSKKEMQRFQSLLKGQK